ncbi:MAG: membrane dipeptidase [Mesorhizobium sp.]|uniref:dipeptidase n=1 Tax=Mesorhizobium sp. TaxID=1871066 RepID=UPI000FE76396|nr:membrane dipeptidase [Mesorhizobium sp.]RWD59520.1 MAG: membrane dipeptidase [Mesorhizobium sp.]RWE39509.1 MAG: membrane dipeptidase [Mesorhizobium sp.]
MVLSPKFKGVIAMDVTQFNVDELFQKSIVWDAHCGMDPQVPIDVNSLERIRKAGFTFVSTNVGYDVLPWHDTFPVIAGYRKFLSDNRDKYILVSSVADVLAAKREGKLAVSMDIEGVSALDGKIELVETYHRLGVRQISFVYNKDNAGGSGCHGSDSGITQFGREVVREMNRVGMLVDGTHCSPQMSIDMAETSSKPIVISHSNSRVLHDHPRNIWNEQAIACAHTGGVIGVTGIRLFLAKPGDSASNLDLLVRNIDHYCELVGPQHVGIGTDFSEITNALATRFENATDYWPLEHYQGAASLEFVDIEVFPQLTAALSAKGYSNNDISGILGGNFLRVAAANWE